MSLQLQKHQNFNFYFLVRHSWKKIKDTQEPYANNHAEGYTRRPFILFGCIE